MCLSLPGVAVEDALPKFGAGLPGSCRVVRSIDWVVNIWLEGCRKEEAGKSAAVSPGTGVPGFETGDTAPDPESPNRIASPLSSAE